MAIMTTTSCEIQQCFMDLNILNCASGSKIETNSEMSELKDLRSFTGVESAYRTMAISPDATKLLFKYVCLIVSLLECFIITKGISY